MASFKHFRSLFQKPAEARTADTPKEEPRTRLPYRPTHRAFHGAAVNRLTGDWGKGGLLSADRENSSALNMLRARARDLCRNNPHAKRYLDLLAVNVIGAHGIKLQARFRTTGDELDTQTNALIETHWSAWGQSATADGKMTWQDVEQLAIRTVARDGEFFVRFIVDDAVNAYGFALQILSADQLDIAYNVNQFANDVDRIVQGVEMNAYGRPLAYHFLKRHPSEGGNGNERLRIPADEIVHLFRQEEGAQTRGVTWFAPVMTHLRTLAEYQTATIDAAKLAASAFAVIKSDPSNEMAYENDFTSPTFAEIQSGVMMRLDPGEELQTFDPPQQTLSGYADFIKANLRAVASGLGTSYAALADDLESTSFSSGRIGMGNERDAYRVLQSWISRTLHQRVYEAWLEIALLSGALPLGTRVASPFKRVEWQPRGWKYVDPSKDVAAYKEMLAIGLTSRRQIHAEIGADTREIFADLDLEQQMASEFGINVDPNGGSSPPGSAPTPTAQTNSPADDDFSAGESFSETLNRETE